MRASASASTSVPGTARTVPSRPSSPSTPTPSRHPAGSSSSPSIERERDRELEARAGLAHRGGGEVDGDPLVRPRDVRRLHRGAHPLARLAPGGVGQADDGVAGQAVGDVHLDGDAESLDAEQGGAVHGGDHDDDLPDDDDVQEGPRWCGRDHSMRRSRTVPAGCDTPCRSSARMTRRGRSGRSGPARPALVPRSELDVASGRSERQRRGRRALRWARRTPSRSGTRAAGSGRSDRSRSRSRSGATRRAGRRARPDSTGAPLGARASGCSSRARRDHAERAGTTPPRHRRTRAATTDGAHRDPTASRTLPVTSEEHHRAEPDRHGLELLQPLQLVGAARGCGAAPTRARRPGPTVTATRAGSTCSRSASGSNATRLAWVRINRTNAGSVSRTAARRRAMSLALVLRDGCLGHGSRM